MKPESIKFLHQIKERAGYIPDVMSLVNSIFYEEGHASEILERTTITTRGTCLSCGADWTQAGEEVDVLIAKCSECALHFGR